jgi:ComF family protein
MLIRFPDWAAQHGIDCLVPIPLHPRRLRWRGFNQSELLAQSLSRIWQVPVVSTALVRTSYHQHQAGKNRVERQLVTHDFALINDQLAGRNICLIDDVITTGATLRSAVSALEKSADQRPKNITALAFARA